MTSDVTAPIREKYGPSNLDAAFLAFRKQTEAQIYGMLMISHWDR